MSGLFLHIGIFSERNPVKQILIAQVENYVKREHVPSDVYLQVTAIAEKCVLMENAKPNAIIMHNALADISAEMEPATKGVKMMPIVRREKFVPVGFAK